MGNMNRDAVCGSMRVTHRVEGYEYETRWCERREGPCPFPGTQPSKAEGTRPCGAEPSTTMSVRWAPVAIQEAHDDLVQNRDEKRSITTETAMVAIDALRACGANES